MEECRIFVTNIGYARDIDGSALRHVLRSHRHFYLSADMQRLILNACRSLIKETRADICCFLEIDTGSLTSGGFDQFSYLTAHAIHEYPYWDVTSKYTSIKLRRSIFTAGKSNGFIAHREYKFQRLYLSRGSKRLLYRIELTDLHVLFFTHLSLRPRIRLLQLKELRTIADREQHEVIIAGDFNIFAGLDELNILVGDGRYWLANDPNRTTFQLFGRHYLIDLCIASHGLKDKLYVDIIPQPYSDHDALLIHLKLQ